MTEAPETRAPSLPVRAHERGRGRLLEGRLGIQMLRFGAPLVLGMALHTTFNLVDMYMIGRLPNATPALAALGICDMLAAIATILSTGFSTAAVAVIARHVGAGYLTGIRRATWQSLWLVGVLSIAFGLVGIFGSDYVVREVMRAKGETAELAVPYLEIMLGGSFSIFLLLQLTAILRALGHAKTAATLLVGGNALNFVLAVVLIFGSGPAPAPFGWGPPIAAALGIPPLGVVGAAWATLIGRTVPVVVGALVLARRRGGPRFHRAYLWPRREQILALVRIGWPSSAQLVVRVGVVLVFLSLVSGVYTTADDPSVLTGYSICLRLETMALFIGMGWGAAASSFMGANLGAARLERAHRAGWVAAAYNAVLMMLLGLLYVRYADVLVGIFDDSPAVLAVGREYLGAVAWSYVALGIGLVLSQAMTGAGATFPGMVLDMVVLLGGIVPAAYITTEGLELGREALWRVIAAGNVVAAVGFVAYYARRGFLGARV